MISKLKELLVCLDNELDAEQQKDIVEFHKKAIDWEMVKKLPFWF